MDSDSDGDEIGDKNKSLQRVLKTKRSVSVGSMSLAEIRKIIGVNKLPLQVPGHFYKSDKKDDISDNKMHEKSVGATNDNNNINIPKSQQESFSTANVNLTPDQIFKNSKKVQRTPPMATSSQEQSQSELAADVFSQKTDVTNEESLYFTHIGSQKRQRSDSSPASIERNKIKKQNYQDSQDYKKNIENDYVAKPTEEILNAVLDSLQIVHEFTTSNSPNESTNVQSALFTIHKHVTTLAFRIGQTEKNNLVLRNQIKELTSGVGTALHIQSPSPSVTPTPQPTLKPDKPSFSDMLKFVPAHNNPGSPENITDWKTPPKTKHETIVKIKGQTDPKVVLQELKQNIRTSDVPGTFKRVKQLPTGSIIIECQNASQQEKLKTSLASSSKNIEIKTISNTDPMIMVTGILKGYTPECFIKEFINENPDVTVTFGSDVANHLKFITKRDCKNKTKENWIFQTPPDIFKWVIRNNSLTFDLCPA